MHVVAWRYFGGPCTFLEVEIKASAGFNNCRPHGMLRFYTYFCKMLLVLLLLVVVCLFSSGYSQTYPSSVLVPSNAITADVSFTCNFSNPEWRVNGTALTFGNIPLGITTTVLNGIPALTVEKASVLRYNETSIQCRQHDGGNWSSIPNTFIRVYGTSIYKLGSPT